MSLMTQGKRRSWKKGGEGGEKEDNIVRGITKILKSFFL